MQKLNLRLAMDSQKSMDEFSIIKYFAKNQPVNRADVVLGSGDDCALLQVPTGQTLAVSMDTLVAGVHFPVDFPAYDTGYKALAVNLSDLAAMGAEPAWFTCALTLPQSDIDWIKKFAEGLFALATEFNIQLVGGDLTRGETLSITIQVHGFVPAHLALRQCGAKVGDAIYVSSKIGAASALRYYYRPYPRIALGLALRGKAHSAIDISDGLAADLTRILQASQVGATIYVEKLPLAKEIKNNYTLALTGGDDYELCFTAPHDLILSEHEITCIGHIEEAPGLRILQADGAPLHLQTLGYQHF